MNLEQQLATIINDAANYGVPTIVVERAIAPVLKLFAIQLQHREYYILQNLAEEWVLTTISNRQLDPTEEKKVIYAFVSVRDAANFQGKNNPEIIAVPIPIIELLFKLFSLQQVDSIIFLEDSFNLNRGVEVKRELLLQEITRQLQQFSQTPPDIA